MNIYSYVNNLLEMKIDETIRECQEHFEIIDDNGVDINSEIRETYELQYKLVEVIVNMLDKQIKGW